MIVRRTAAALLAPFVLMAGGKAEAQSSPAPDRSATSIVLNAVPDADLAVREERARDLGPGGDGLIRSWSLEGSAVLGVGRFTVAELARPRTYVEDDDAPTSVRSRDQGIAAVGLKIPF